MISKVLQKKIPKKIPKLCSKILFLIKKFKKWNQYYIFNFF
jgi:hypothetical protein